jgi:hypothetical protein
VSSLVMSFMGWPSMPPDPFTVFTQALYTSSPGTESAPNGPEQLHIKPTTIGAPVAVREPAVDEPPVDEPAVDEPAVDEPAVDDVDDFLALDPHAANETASNSTAAMPKNRGRRPARRPPAESFRFEIQSVINAPLLFEWSGRENSIPPATSSTSIVRSHGAAAPTVSSV